MTLEFNQIWGFSVVFIGLIFLLRGKIDVGIRGRPASFVITGKWATVLSILTISLGLVVAFHIQERI